MTITHFFMGLVGYWLLSFLIVGVRIYNTRNRGSGERAWPQDVGEAQAPILAAKPIRN